MSGVSLKTVLLNSMYSILIRDVFRNICLTLNSPECLPLVLKYMVAKICWSFFYPVQALSDAAIARIMIIYTRSLLVSGMFSRTLHQIVRLLLYFVQFLYTVSYWYSPAKPKKILPPMESSLLSKSAIQLAKDIRNRKVSCEEVVSTFIKRIKQVNPILNCVVENRFNDALKEAAAVDDMIASKPDAEYWEKQKPLLGIPVTIKESIGVKGMSNNSARSRPSVKKLRATEDAEAVALLRRAGAIPIAVTTTPEMCMNWECFNTFQGVSRNPYDTRRVTGGSSGGEAGLLGAGASVIGLGSDLAGSIRIPSFFCGIWAHKATPGYVPVNGHVPCADDPRWYLFFSIGAMCRYAEDLRLSLTALIPEKNNPASLHLDLPVDVKNIKIYYTDSLGKNKSLLNPIGRDMKACLMQVIHHMKITHNSDVTQVNLEAGDILALGFVLMGSLKNIESIYQVDDDHPNEWNSVLATLIKGAFRKHHPSAMAVSYAALNYLVQRIPDDLVERVREKKDNLRKCVEDIVGDDGVLLVPTFPEAAPYHGTMSYKFLESAYLAIFNILQLPVTQCPIFGITQDGLPLGIQVVGKRGQDRLCLAVAEALSKGFGGWQPPPST